jgi:hypothetical protein
MEAFLSEALVCLPLMGLSAFESPAERPASARVYYARARGANAIGFESAEGFVVQQGSVVSSTQTDSLPVTTAALRQELRRSGVIVERNGAWVMTQDYVFSSPSTAANVVLGKNANGRTEWKDERGLTLKQLQHEEA